jgi:hypothetical protein
LSVLVKCNVLRAQNDILADLFIAADVSSQSQLSILPTAFAFRPAQDEFLEAVIGKRRDSPILASACRWYISFLECRILQAWVSLFQPALIAIDESATHPSDKDLDSAFQFLTVVALACRNSDNLALTDIVDSCYNHELLQDTDEDRSIAHQLAFASIGWLSECFCS